MVMSVSMFRQFDRHRDSQAVKACPLSQVARCTLARHTLTVGRCTLINNILASFTRDATENRCRTYMRIVRSLRTQCAYRMPCVWIERSRAALGTSLLFRCGARHGAKLSNAARMTLRLTREWRISPRRTVKAFRLFRVGSVATRRTRQAVRLVHTRIVVSRSTSSARRLSRLATVGSRTARLTRFLTWAIIVCSRRAREACTLFRGSRRGVPPSRTRRTHELRTIMTRRVSFQSHHTQPTQPTRQPRQTKMTNSPPPWYFCSHHSYVDLLTIHWRRLMRTISVSPSYP
jgi:hypothetical protein